MLKSRSRIAGEVLMIATLAGGAAAQSPRAPINTVNELEAALLDCWVPPPIEQSRPGPSNVASRACPSASSAARYKSKLGSGSDEILKQHTNLVEEYNDYCFYNIKRRRP
jgi:hypothetical protein